MNAADIRLAKDGKIYAKGVEVGEYWYAFSGGWKYALWAPNLKGHPYGDAMYKNDLRYMVAKALYDE